MNSSNKNIRRRSDLVKFVVFTVGDYLRTEINFAQDRSIEVFASYVCVLAFHKDFISTPAENLYKKFSETSIQHSKVSEILTVSLESYNSKITLESVILEFVPSFRDSAAELSDEEFNFEAIYLEVIERLTARTSASGQFSGFSNDILELIANLSNSSTVDADSCYIHTTSGLPAQLAASIKSSTHLTLDRAISSQDNIIQILNLLALREYNDFGAHSGFNSDTSPTKESFSSIISIPAFRGRGEKEDRLRDCLNAMGDIQFKRAYSDELAVYQAYLYLKNLGTAYIVVPHSFLFSKTVVKEVRKELIESNSLRAVVSLPIGSFTGARINVALIILEKGAVNNKTTFIDVTEIDPSDSKGILTIINSSIAGKDTGYSTVVDRVELASEGYDLSPQRYCYKGEEVQIPEGYKKVRLGELVKRVANRRLRDSSNFGVVLGSTVNDFGDLLEDKWGKEERHIRNSSKVERESLLFLPIGGGKQFKIAHIAPSDYTFTIGCSPNFYILEATSNLVSLDWLKFEMLSEGFQMKARSLSQGSVTPRINVRNLLEIEIVVPPLEAQHQLAENLKNQLMKRKAHDQGLEELLVKTREEFLNSARVKKHNLSQILPRIYPKIQALIWHLEEGGQIEKDTHFEDFSMSAVELLQVTKTLIQDLGSNIKLLDQEGVVSPKLEEFDLVRFLKSEYLKYSAAQTQVDLLPKVSKAVVEWSKVNVSSAIGNIVNNALQHGTHPDGSISIVFFIYLKGDYYHIIVANNGKPLAEGFNTARYISQGGKAGKLAMTGLGGYHIDQFAKQAGGTVELYDLHRTDEAQFSDGLPIQKVTFSHPEMTVAVEIKIPNIEN